MILLTRTQRAQLLANGRRRGIDHVPVVKFFNPFGEGVNGGAISGHAAE